MLGVLPKTSMDESFPRHSHSYIHAHVHISEFMHMYTAESCQTKLRQKQHWSQQREHDHIVSSCLNSFQEWWRVRCLKTGHREAKLLPAVPPSEWNWHEGKIVQGEYARGRAQKWRGLRIYIILEELGNTQSIPNTLLLVLATNLYSYVT